MNDPKVNLRAMEPEDLDELYTIENDREVWNVGHTNVPYSRYALHDYIAHQQADIYADRQVRLIVENGKKQLVGIVDLVNFDPQHRRAEFGIVVKQAFRRMGYGRLAVERLLHYAQHVLHLHQVYVLVDAGNHEALKLFQQSGFQDGTQLKDWLFDGKSYHDVRLMQFFF